MNRKIIIEEISKINKNLPSPFAFAYNHTTRQNVGTSDVFEHKLYLENPIKDVICYPFVQISCNIRVARICPMS